DETFYLPDGEVRDQFLDRFHEGDRLAVTHYTDPSGTLVTVALGNEEQTQPLWENDITVRVATDPVELKTEPGVHKYVLYNGPVKPQPLSQMSGDAAVDPGLIAKYVDALNLRTLTDYHSQGVFGTISYTIGWNWLLIACTNLMHWVLGGLNTFIPNYG